jgi:hypothetical protein
MKAKVIIQDGITTIELTPETSFEKDVIEKAKDSPNNSIVDFSYGKEPYYSENKNHKISITITKKITP